MRRTVAVCFVLVFGVLACLGGQPAQTTATPAAIAQTPAEGQTPGAEQTAAPTGSAATDVPPPEGMPPQSSAATIQPQERREELTRLSHLLDFQVTGLNGAVFGTAADFIINTCETYIIYFVVDPAAELNLERNTQLVIPFEAITINSGILEAEAKHIALYLGAGSLSNAPAFPAPLALFPNEWEAPVRDYWGNVVRVGKLSSECRAGGGGPLHKIAYARELLVAELKDGNQQLLGKVVEAILEPESGKLGFYVVERQADHALVLVPLGKTNIPEVALQPGNTIELVLLADNKVLAGAPSLSSLEQASKAQSQATARGYWGQ